MIDPNDPQSLMLSNIILSGLDVKPDVDVLTFV